MEMETTAVDCISVPVDADFKDGELYEVFCPEGSDEPWHVVVSVEENGKFTHWALMQMLQAKEWGGDFEWAVFMKTGRCGSSGLRHFSKKFTDGAAALKTFADWFEDKTGNRWLGDFTTTQEQFTAVPNKYTLLNAEEGRSVLEFRGERERSRLKLGTTDVPVDVYFKDREQYQVYVTPDGDLWTAVMSIKEGDRHSQYAILQVLVAKPDVKVEFDFVVFMRHGKLGGSAQRYAKRYTVEVAALSTFQQWFKEKTANDWYGSFNDTLEEFSPQFGKFHLLDRPQWAEVVEFEERSKSQLIDSDVPVDQYYRDRESYRVYHTDNGDLWAAVLSEKDENGVHRRFVLLQMLAKKPEATVDFDFVVLRRVGERGESGQWTAKKFTNELDALRTFKMWYQDETGNQWRGSFSKSHEEFTAVPDKMQLQPQSEWEEATRDVPIVLDPSQFGLETFLAEGRRSRILNSSSASVKSGAGSGIVLSGPQKVSIDVLKRAMAAEDPKAAAAEPRSPSAASSVSTPTLGQRSVASVRRSPSKELKFPEIPSTTKSQTTAKVDKVEQQQKGQPPATSSTKQAPTAATKDVAKQSTIAATKDAPSVKQSTTAVSKEVLKSQSSIKETAAKPPASKPDTPATVSSTKQATTAATKDAPSAKQATTAATKDAPSAKQATTAATKDAPSAKQATTAATRDAPSVKQSTTAATKDAPSAKQATTAATRDAPSVKQSTTAVSKEVLKSQSSIKETAAKPPASKPDTPATDKTKVSTANPKAPKVTPAVDDQEVTAVPRSVAAESSVKRKTDQSSTKQPTVSDPQSTAKAQEAQRSVPSAGTKSQQSTPRSLPTATAAEGQTPPKPAAMPAKKKPSAADKKDNNSPSKSTIATLTADEGDSDDSSEEVDSSFEQRDNFTSIVYSTKMVQNDASGKTKFYSMQLLEATSPSVPPEQKYCFFVRTGKLGTNGASNFKLLGSLDVGKKSFAKKFQQKTNNQWLGNFEKTNAQFSPVEGEFELVKSFGG